MRVAEIEPRGWIAAVLNRVGISAARLTPSTVKSVSLVPMPASSVRVSSERPRAAVSEIRDSGRPTARPPT